MKKLNLMFLSAFLVFAIALVGCNQTGNDGSSSNSSQPNPDVPETISQQALASVQTAVEINGTYSLFGYTHDFTTIFSETSYYNAETYFNDDYPEVVVPYSEVNVLLENDEVYLLQSKADNTETKTKIDYEWSIFENPFQDLTVDDFIYDELFDCYSVATNKQLALGNAVTNWNHTEPVEMTVTVENDVITSMTATLSTEYDGDITYEMTFSNHSTAKAPSVTYETKPEHEALQTAFEAFNNQNYTVTVSDEAYSEEDKPYDVTYHIYRTDSAWYHDYEEIGYAHYNDAIYDFSVENDVAVLGTEFTEFNPFSYTPSLEVAPELFTLVEEGTYKLTNSFLVPIVMPSFAISSDLYSLGGYYGMDFYVYVDNGTLTGFSFNYNVQTLYACVTATFSEVGTTEMPFEIDFGEPGGEDPTLPVIPTEYIGNYSGELSQGTFNGETAITIEITADTITVNGVEATITAYDAYEGFTLILNDVEYYLYNMNYDGGIELAFMSADYEVMGLNITKDSSGEDPDPSVTIPTEFIGTHTGTLSQGTFNGETAITIEITADTITVNGVEATITAYDAYEGFTLTIDGNVYYLMNGDYSGGVSLAFMSEDYSIIGSGFIKDSTGEEPGGEDPDPSVTIPTEFIGTHTGTLSQGTFNGETAITIEITADTITVNGVEATITAYDAYEGFTLTIDGNVYYLMNGDYSGGVSLAFMSEDYSIIGSGFIKDSTGEEPGGEDPDPSVTIPTEYIGTFSGELTSGTFYDETAIEITITASTITINGKEATITAYDETEGFTLMIDDVEYYLYNMDYDGGLVLAFMSADYEIMGLDITKDSTSEEPVAGDALQGTWEDDNGNVFYFDGQGAGYYNNGESYDFTYSINDNTVSIEFASSFQYEVTITIQEDGTFSAYFDDYDYPFTLIFTKQ